MKVIVANYRYFIAGGPEKYMFKFIEAAQKRNIEVIPFSVDNPQNVETRYKKYFAKPRSKQLLYKDTKFNLKNIYGMIRAVIWNYDAEKKLRKLIRDEKPDVIYILHEINHLSPSIIRAAKKENIRVVHRISDFFMFCAKYDFLCKDEVCELCIHGNYKNAIKNKCVKDSKLATLIRIFAMKLYNRLKIFNDVDLFITPSNFTKSKLIEGGISKNKIIHIPTFIDTNRIIPSYIHEKYFLFLGRLAHQKGAIYAIKAMNEVKNSDYILKITGELGNSKEDDLIRRYIDENKLNDKIVFTGFLHGEELESIISKSTAIVCPAIWYENMPNTVLEAYAYGKPVIASDIGSFKEIIEDNITGFKFPVKDYKELGKIYKKFIDDDNLSRSLGEKSRKKCEEEFNEEKHMNLLIKLLKDEI